MDSENSNVRVSTKPGQLQFGYGWTVNIPYIERLNKRGTNNLYTDTSFFSLLDGELVAVNGTTYRARDDNGAYRTYTISDTVWTVKEKNGITYSFGATSASRYDDPNNGSRIARWMLDTKRDTNNNFISYRYFKNARQIYPDTIMYTGLGSTDGVFKIEFLRAARGDDLVIQVGICRDHDVPDYEIKDVGRQ